MLCDSEVTYNRRMCYSYFLSNVKVKIKLQVQIRKGQRWRVYKVKLNNCLQYETRGRPFFKINRLLIKTKTIKLFQSSNK